MSISRSNELTPRSDPADLANVAQRTPSTILSPHDPGMDPEASALDIDLVHYWRILVKSRLLVLTVIIACLAIGAAVTVLTQPMYTADASLQLDREAAKVVSGQDENSGEQLIAGDEFFQTQYGLLRSRSLAIRVADALNLAQSDNFALQMGAKPKPAERREQVLKLLSSNLGVTPLRGSRLVTVSFSSPSADLAALVANGFAEQFIEANLDRRFQASSYARDFLEKQLAVTKAKLEDSERALVAYAQSQQIIELNQPSQSGGPTEQQSLASANLEALNTSLAAAQAARIQAEQNWREAQGTSGLGLPEILQSPTVQELAQERAKLNADYQNKLKLFKPEYPDMLQLKAQIDELDRQLSAQASTIRQSLFAQYQAALKNERALSGQVDSLKASVLDLRQRSIEYNILQREVDTNRTLYDGLLQRYKEVGVEGAVAANNISIVDHAEAPSKPSKPRPTLNMAVAGLSGVLLGVVMALVREAMDQGVRIPADIEAKLGLPSLGAAPILAKGIQPREALEEQKSSLTESYLSIRSALQFSTEQGFPSSVLITSARPGEGKSTTAFALARLLARMGYSTLLIDADLRNPSLHKSMGADNRLGLTNILTNAAAMPEVVQKSDIANLYLVPSGPLPPNPAELLAGARLDEFVREASEAFDIVMMDGPPVMGLADAPSIGAVVAGVVLVVESGKTGRVQARAAVRRLIMANGRMLGVILTKFNSRQASYGYGYGHGYGYEYDYDYGKTTDGPDDGRKKGLLWSTARAMRFFSE